MRLAFPYEEFAVVARRLNLVPRCIAAQEAIEDGDTEGAFRYMADLQRELVRAIRQNEELEEAA